MLSLVFVDSKVNRSVDDFSAFSSVKGKGKGPVLAIAMSRTCGQNRFTISEVADDWHELMIPQLIMRPSVARISEQLDPRFSANRHITARISHAMPSPHSP